jgi:dipeptidyl-peptidase-4
VKKKLLAFLLLMLFFVLDVFSFNEKLTIELLFDRNFQDKLSTPQHVWLKNNRALILDTRVEKQKHSLEFFDPRIGKREPALDKDRVLSKLNAFLAKEAPSSIRWPDAVDVNGNAFVYLINGDIFCVELSNSNVNQLTKTPSLEMSPSFSPDGNWICFIRENDLYAIEWKTGIEKRLTTGATETLLNGPLSWVYWEEIYNHTSVPYQWSPDSKAIAYLQTDESMVSISTFVHFKPATQAVVYQRYPKAGQTNPKVHVGIVELSSSKTTWMDCGEYEYLARFDWLPDSNKIAVQTLDRKQQELRLFFSDRATGESRQILIEKEPTWINLNDALYFLNKGKQFIWMSERDGYQHLYLYEMDGHLIRQLTKGNFMVLSSGGDRDLSGIDEEHGCIYFISNKDVLKERHLYRIKLDGTRFERMSKEEGVHTVSFSPSLEYYFDTFSNSLTPPSLCVFKADGTKTAVIAPSAKDVLEKYKISYPEFHTFRAEDELELPAMLIKPLDFDPKKKYPALINVYGGPGSPQVIDSWDRSLWRSFLAQEGFFVFVFEVRAGIKKNKDLERSIYKRVHGIRNVKDILAGVLWLKQMPYIDLKRLGIWGGSGGGAMTIQVMTSSDVIKAGIARAPGNVDWHLYDTIWTERYMDTPQDNPEGYEETSTVLRASNLKGRLLIIHGTYDDNVHIQNTYAFINELIEHNIQFELMIYPWRKHGIDDISAQIHSHYLMLDFWNRHLKQKME